MTVVVQVQGITFLVDYDHQKKEHATLTYPGCPESVEINSISVNGSGDITECLSAYCWDLIREKIMEQC